VRFWVMRSLKSFAVILFLVSLSLLRPASANGPSHVLAAYGTPTVDGVIEPDEYASCETGTQSGLTFTFCETNDAVNNYFAFQVDDTKYSTSDYLDIRNDDENDGSLTECNTSENYFGLRSDQGYTDGHYCYDQISGHISTTADTNEDGSAVLNWVVDVGYVYEFSHPLDSVNVNDYHVGPGDTVGWCLQYGNYTGPGNFDTFDYPVGCYSPTTTSQSGFGDILILDSSWSVQTATDSGTATFQTSAGGFSSLTAVAEDSIPPEGKPNLEFPHGFFSFTIAGLEMGATVTVTITLPSPVPVGTQYWKYGPTPTDPTDHWYQLPIGDDDGDDVITITPTDNGLGDDILTGQDGQIVDQGGPGISGPAPAGAPVGGVVTPVNTLALVAPWLAVIGVVACIGIVVVVVRKRQS
jgi:hypothetical protein